MCKSFIACLLVVFICVAGELPNVAKHPWFKTYNGYSLRQADVKLSTEGEIIVFPKVEEKRVIESKAITVNVLIEFQAKGSERWIKKTIQKNEFEVPQPAKAPRKKVEIIGTVTGDLKFKLRLEHEKKAVNIFAEFVDMPDYSTGKYRLSIISECPDLYSLSLSAKKREISTKTRGDAVTLIPVHDDDIRKKRYRIHEKIDLKPYEKAGIRSIELEANRYGKNDILWKLVDDNKGTLKLLPKNFHSGFHKGFDIKTILVDQTGELQSKGLRIEVD